MQQRLQKIIAASGFCSRRAAEELIQAGRVAVNGAAAVLGETADDRADRITIDGSPLQGNAPRTYIMLNKPRGYVTTMEDDKGRKTVSDLTCDVGARVFPVGRLDYDSEGLLIMTDDGELANRLMHPSGGVKKTYEARVRGADIDAASLRLRQPFELDGYVTKPAEVKLRNKTQDGAVFLITISEGKNRQVRKMCALCALEVLRLRRVAEGSLELGALPSGKWRYLTADEIENLQKKI